MKVVVSENLKSNLYKLETTGTEQFKEFMRYKIWKKTSLLSDTISKNKLYLFKSN